MKRWWYFLFFYDIPELEKYGFWCNKKDLFLFLSATQRQLLFKVIPHKLCAQFNWIKNQKIFPQISWIYMNCFSCKGLRLIKSRFLKTTSHHSVRDRLQTSILILRKFQRINKFQFLLKPLKSHRFFDNFSGNKSYIA